MEAALSLRPAPRIPVERPGNGPLSLHRARHLIPAVRRRRRHSLLGGQGARVGPTRRCVVVSAAQTATPAAGSPGGAQADGEMMQLTLGLLQGIFLGPPSPSPTRRGLVAYSGTHDEVLLMDWIEALLNQQDYDKADKICQDLLDIAPDRDARPRLIKAIISMMLIVESMLSPDKTSILKFEEKIDEAKPIWIEFKKLYDDYAKPPQPEVEGQPKSKSPEAEGQTKP